MRRWEHREEIRLVLTSGLLVGNRERSSVDGSLAQRAPRQGKRRTGARGPFSGEACHCVGWPRGSCGRHLVRYTPPPGASRPLCHRVRPSVAWRRARRPVGPGVGQCRRLEPVLTAGGRAGEALAAWRACLTDERRGERAQRLQSRDTRRAASAIVWPRCASALLRVSPPFAIVFLLMLDIEAFSHSDSPRASPSGLTPVYRTPHDARIPL